MFNYPGKYVQLPKGVFSTTLGSIFNYPGEYVQLPWGVCSTTLGSMFNYPREYVQLPWGVFSTTLGCILNYPGEYLQLLLGGIGTASLPTGSLSLAQRRRGHWAPRDARRATSSNGVTPLATRDGDGWNLAGNPVGFAKTAAAGQICLAHL